MTDYSRFIAYIYEYVNGMKQYNAGFTKVEVRNGICKLQLVMRNVGRESKVRVYGLVRIEGHLLGILLGEGQTQRQRLDMRIITESEKIGGSDYPFQKITGLFIQGAEGRTYATAWDEEPLFLDKFVTELPEKETMVHAAQVEEIKEAEEAVPIAEETAIEESEEQDKEDEEIQEQPIFSTDADAVQEETEEEIADTQEWGDGEEEGTAAEEEVVTDQTPEGESELERQNHLVSQEEQQQETIQEEEQTEEQEAEPQSMEPQDAKNDETALTLKEKKEERWNAILNSYPRIDPFEDDEISECVQIAPKDLMQVCQQEWRLGRNSFLLHGYYNYRHLILGKTEDDRWILGVPGMYERQEHFVASRFGFAGFKPARQEKSGEKPFGYWCRVLL